MSYDPQSNPLRVPIPQSWKQATWFVDPANSTGLANDDNSGLDATHPVLSYNGGIVRKWGTQSPRLEQNTTMTWMSDQPIVGDVDPVVLTPQMVDSYLIIQGVLTAAQLLHSGVLGAVTPKNRATGQILAADLGFVAPIGALVINTTHPSRAWTYINTTGTVFDMTQPMRPMTPPLDSAGTDGHNPAEVDTWAAGDSIEIYQPVAANITYVDPIEVTFVSNQAVFFGAAIQFYQLTFISPIGPGNNDTYVGDDVNIIECTLQTDFIDIAVSDDETVFHQNSFFAWGVFAAAGANPLTTIRAGAIVAAPMSDSMINWNLDFDVVLDSTVGPMQLHKLVVLSIWSYQGLVYINGTMRFFGPWCFFPGGGLTSLNPSIVWGPGTIDTGNYARMSYASGAGAAAATFLNLGGLMLNGQANATAFDPTTGLWSVLIPITPANLDLAFSSGGFGGLAMNMGGSSYTNQGTP